MAGDVEVIGPQRVSPGATNWSGLYIGASAGRTSGDIGWQYVIPADETGALTREPSGGIYGGHIGIQHQIGRIVVGIEAAWTGGAFDKIDELGPDSPPFAVDYDAYARLHAIRQIGPRLGLVMRDQWMLYATGGYASASLETLYVLRDPGIVGGQDTVWHNGWFLGGGVEYALTKSIILGLEYTHYDFDIARHDNSDPPGFATTRDIRGEFDVVRARISFKLGREEVAAADEPLK